VKGKISVRATVERVAIDRYFDGLLLKKGLSIGFRFHCSASFWGRAIDRFVRALRNDALHLTELFGAVNRYRGRGDLLLG
jgi:hypothetical protein